MNTFSQVVLSRIVDSFASDAIKSYHRQPVTLIDLIYTNYPDKVVCSGVCHVSISDHSLVFAYRKLSIGAVSKTHNTINYRTFENFNRDHFRNDIASQNWDVLDNFQDRNDMGVSGKLSS